MTSTFYHRINAMRTVLDVVKSKLDYSIPLNPGVINHVSIDDSSLVNTVVTEYA